MGNVVWTVKNFQRNPHIEEGFNSEIDVLYDVPDEISIDDTSQDPPRHRMGKINWHHHPDYPDESPHDSVTGVNFGAGRSTYNQYLQSGTRATENPLQHNSEHLIQALERYGKSGDVPGGLHHSLELYLGESRYPPEAYDEEIFDRQREHGRWEPSHEAYFALLENDGDMNEHESEVFDEALNSEDSVLRVSDMDQAARISNALYRHGQRPEERYSLICGDEAGRQNQFTEQYDMRITVEDELSQAEVDQVSSGGGGFFRRLLGT